MGRTHNHDRFQSRGYDDRYDGKSVNACPYRRDSIAATCWLEGWNDADDELELGRHLSDD